MSNMDMSSAISAKSNDIFTPSTSSAVKNMTVDMRHKMIKVWREIQKDQRDLDFRKSAFSLAQRPCLPSITAQRTLTPIPNQRSGGCVTPKVCPMTRHITSTAPTPDEQLLLDRLSSNQFIEDQSSHGTDDRNERLWFNRGVRHAVGIVEQWIKERSIRRAERVNCFRHDAAFAAVEPSLKELAAFEAGEEAGK